MKKQAFFFLLMLLLFLALPSLSVATADTTESPVYIHADGTIEGTSSIQRNGDYYTLTSNFTGPLYVEKDNIVIDGAGYAVNNGSVRGVVLAGRSGVTLKNTVVTLSGGYIIDVGGASDCSLINNTLVGLPTILSIPGLPSTPSVGPYAVNFLYSRGITVKDNYITGFFVALSIEWSSGHTITGNTLTGGVVGIDIIDSPNCIFRNNNLTDCRLSVRIYPSYHYQNDLDTSNTLNGKPIYYWQNIKDKTVPSDAGYIVLIGCRNIQVTDCSPECISLVSTNNSFITNVHMTGWSDGITLQNCSGVTISNSVLRDLNIAVDLSYSNGNILSGNGLLNNSRCIMLDHADTNRFSDNNIADSGYAVSSFQDTVSSGNIYRSNSFTGNSIALSLRGNATVDANRFADNDYGIYLSATTGSTITQNTFTNNTYALYFSGSSDNRIYLNNFLNNTHQVYDAGAGTTYSGNAQLTASVVLLVANVKPLNFLPPPPPSHNQFDNGSRGNYWIDYNGFDSNGDGIGDSTYVLYGDNQDNYPLMQQVIPVVTLDPTPTFSPSDPTPTVTQAGSSTQSGSSNNTPGNSNNQPASTTQPVLPELPIQLAAIVMAVVLVAVGLAVYCRQKQKRIASGSCELAVSAGLL